MSQEPWNEEVYQTETVSRKERLNKGVASTTVFTVLAIIFFVIVLIIGITAIYLSVGGSKTDSTKEFYNPSSAAVVAESSTSVAETQESTSTDAAETETTETSSSLAEATDGSTLTVQAGEGVGQLAARGGISIAELERLNPEKMTTGSWLAHPGDVVRIR
ncbi:TPA: LysM peptidoglycan-binding domain-containing protein [Streptococcus suis]|uniref:SAG1386/EF1546 family surface-associated protein n=1 Tax=Streptococcus suis TaxID=1307 RepID=UPI00195FE112|nr:SAG1386/EF1546 family surface-associated protein [Streptococcus suis]MBM7137420.1 LysM peptidoglycan-binding domain-containing protein [Streptococcus suis]MBY4600212.1 LysM peptidoglycan-binding domain-containing protein [Streptococcus suis]MCO8172020.1 LysM peptidoglycan-binding domain-containing protein [Streptococcus suis]MCO8180420.1 LysM peptidoglycan-binding domain-containing protein [Streptococcus suis]MCO8183433.1 LysM peptidoglycan-binding domain-containing protein [Streptococcus s